MTRDRAAVITTAIMMLIADIRDRAELRRAIEELIRDELADITREIAADRGTIP